MTRPPAAAPSRLSDFFKDARGVFNAFTTVALWAGLTLVTGPMVCRLVGWKELNRDEIAALTLLYCIAALGDTLLGVYLNKLPGTVNLDTGGGDATLAAGTGATAETIAPASPPTPPESE